MQAQEHMLTNKAEKVGIWHRKRGNKNVHKFEDAPALS